MPPGWMRIPSADFAAAFVGPQQEGYRPTIGLSNEEFDPPTPAGLADGIEALRARQAAEYDDFEPLSVRDIDIAGGWAYLQHFRWTDRAAGLRITQLLALVVVEPGRVLKVDGACLTSLEAQHLPMLDAIVTSIELAGR